MAYRNVTKALSAYMRAVADPTSLIDQDKIESMRAELASTTDPVNRLVLRNQIRAAEVPDLTALAEPFVQHARAWAQEVGAGPEDFAAEGVPAEVLRQAGFAVASDGARRGQRSNGTRTRVSSSQILSAIPKGAFTIRSLVESTGASIGAVRSALQGQIAEVAVTEIGPDDSFGGPGRRPTLYQRA